MSSENPYAPPEADVAVSDPTQLAGRGVRLGGAMIDGLIITLIIIPLMFATGYWDRAMAGEQTSLDTISLGLFGSFMFLVLHGYLLAKRGQTIGKWLLKIRIVSIHDDKILPFWKVFTYRYLPLLIAGQFQILGPIVSLVDPLFIFRADRRCLHDLIAGTKVVTLDAP